MMRYDMTRNFTSKLYDIWMCIPLHKKGVSKNGARKLHCGNIMILCLIEGAHHLCQTLKIRKMILSHPHIFNLETYPPLASLDDILCVGKAPVQP